jgi:hypothetical protein
LNVFHSLPDPVIERVYQRPTGDGFAPPFHGTIRPLDEMKVPITNRACLSRDDVFDACIGHNGVICTLDASTAGYLSSKYTRPSPSPSTLSVHEHGRSVMISLQLDRRYAIRPIHKSS